MAIFVLTAAACATTPEEGETEKDDDGTHCTVERDMGSRMGTKVCR
ncbi:hypothetical protein [Parvularcula marina]|nr:hypothetical protein [Parvularcula marina]